MTEQEQLQRGQEIFMPCLPVCWDGDVLSSTEQYRSDKHRSHCRALTRIFSQRRGQVQKGNFLQRKVEDGCGELINEKKSLRWFGCTSHGQSCVPKPIPGTATGGDVHQIRLPDACNMGTEQKTGQLISVAIRLLTCPPHGSSL
ncbi:hypothetical protein Bbelb_230770 [Branchiostoma belcheri]|nr:hypothetical protein Bbelb_230770 [Branchiostoma belcheri]